MNRHQTVMVFSTLWLTLFLLGCGRTRDGGKPGLMPEAPPDPVLKPDDDAKTIIGKALKAHGGENAFTRWRCGYLKYTTEGSIVPAQVGGVTCEDTFQLPGYFKRIARAEARGEEYVMVFVVNHRKGWIKRGESPAEPIDNESTEWTEHPFASFCNIPLLTEEGVYLTKLGGEKVNQKDAIGIRARSDRLGEVDFFFGLQTGLLLKSRKLLPGADPATPIVMEAYLDDYEDVQGTRVPMRIKAVQDGKAILDVTLLDARFADRFAESNFAKP